MKDIISSLSTAAAVRTVKKGSNLLFQGEIPRKAFVVRSGLIRSYTITSNGEERIIGLYARGAVLPVSWIFGQASSSLFYFDAVTDSKVVSLDRKQLITQATSSPELSRQLMDYLSSENTASLLRINGLEQSRAIEKIGFMLYYLIFRYGKDDGKGNYCLTIKLSQLMLSNLVGLTRESTTKSLLNLRQKGVIDYKNSDYKINKARLESFLGEDSFRDVKL
ncbi:MAG TPA: Crp/Fnr family transcriptional regulator [Candidatus Saccharimonadales bacterium]|nr:Crp/Fnr family transcriptional regulator [Candidatus Saccharimonadales bacterium]